MLPNFNFLFENGERGSHQASKLTTRSQTVWLPTFADNVNFSGGGRRGVLAGEDRVRHGDIKVDFCTRNMFNLNCNPTFSSDSLVSCSASCSCVCCCKCCNWRVDNCEQSPLAAIAVATQLYKEVQVRVQWLIRISSRSAG